MDIRTPRQAIELPLIQLAIRRSIIIIDGNRITYQISRQKSYNWNDPEEWIRAYTIAWLVLEKDYPANRIATEVSVPRRTPNDWADIVVYNDDQCLSPYLVVENKPSHINTGDQVQGIEQLFGNCNSLRAPLGLYEQGTKSIIFDIINFPAAERIENRLGNRNTLPTAYGEVPKFSLIAGTENDIIPVESSILSSKLRKAHYIIWAGGKRDPLQSFDEWSKLLFAKVIDERTTPSGKPRRFQVGTNETTASVSNKIHNLFREAHRSDPSIFPSDSGIFLPDNKIVDIVKTIQDISFSRTDIDSIGRAFEEFFSSVFRGELGQYFTMRQLARFIVALLDIKPTDYILDPTAGSGGFLLEVLLQTWNNIDKDFAGQDSASQQRLKTDFALSHVFGIEIHQILARICKINLLLHHDGHTNIEADRSCLDTSFENPRLQRLNEIFSVIVGNPPFGDEVKENDEDHLGSNTLSNFEISSGRKKVDSEHVIIERAIQFLEPSGRLGFILPDGFFNNSGSQSNCPQVRELLIRSGKILSIVSLPDFAFRKSGAQNKTSILFFQKYSLSEKQDFDSAYNSLDKNDPDKIAKAIIISDLDYEVFLAEAEQVGYTTTGNLTNSSDLLTLDESGHVSKNSENTILGEYRKFKNSPKEYVNHEAPDCVSISLSVMWHSHASHRLDPKFHIFKMTGLNNSPKHWIKKKLGMVMKRRVTAKHNFDLNKEYKVITISQNGTLREREAGKGNNPPNWLGEYFSLVSPGDWFEAKEGDLVFSSIDLWKGCIAIVDRKLDKGLVTKEFPIYEIIAENLSPSFLSYLLRTHYYQRAFRAITTGHSNRRRTQIADFEDLTIAFPPSIEEQEKLIESIRRALLEYKEVEQQYLEEFDKFSMIVDGHTLILTEEDPDIV